MNRKEISEIQITNIKQFFISWFNALTFGDSWFYNSLAWAMLVQVSVIVWALHGML